MDKPTKTPRRKSRRTIRRKSPGGALWIRKRTKERAAGKPCGKQTANSGEFPAELNSVPDHFWRLAADSPGKIKRGRFQWAGVLPAGPFPICKNRIQGWRNHPFRNRRPNAPRRRQIQHIAESPTPAIAPVCNGSQPVTRRPPAQAPRFSLTTAQTIDNRAV